jgi:GNAT superfamily N-acetyltransferase
VQGGVCTADGDRGAAPLLVSSVTIRPLKEEELELWFDLLERVYLQVFGLPKEYFSRHWFSDPSRSVSDVLVAVRHASAAGPSTVGELEIVSSLRVFRRVVRVEGREVTLGGVGEVGTLARWRGKGIATALLQRAVKLMEATGVAVSGLHGVAAATPLYARLGWTAAASPVCDLDLRCPTTAVAPNARSTGLNAKLHAVLLQSTHPIVMDDEPTRRRLAATYNRFTASEFDGVLTRDEAYWGRWMREPAEGYAPGGPGQPEIRVIHGWEVRDGDVTLAYMLVKVGATAAEQCDAVTVGERAAAIGDRSPPTVLNVLDFAATSAPLADKTEMWLRHLLRVAADALVPEDAAESVGAVRGVVGRVPAVLLHNGVSRADRTEPTSRWMYRGIASDEAAIAATASLVESSRHYVAPIDEY